MPRLLVAVVVAGLLASCTDDRESPAGTSSSQVRNDCPRTIDDALAAWEEAGFSGTVTITTAGEPDCLAGYGVADRAAGTPNSSDTVFAIGSVSKAFTATAIFALVDDGTLSLDDHAGDLVTDLTGPVADTTVEQLLVHTSGLTGSHGTDHAPLSRADAVAAIAGLDLAFEPGSDFLYSNAGYTLLAIIVEEISRTDYRDYMASRVLSMPGGSVAGGFWDGDPAAPGPRAVGELEDGSTGEMGDFAGPHWALTGNGDLAMTTEQLATWTHDLFTGGRLSPDGLDALAHPRFDHDAGQSEAAGWVVFDQSIFGESALASAGGGGDVGHDVVVAWLPESERVVAIASNTAEVTAEDLLQAIAPAVVAGEALPTPSGSTSGEVDPAGRAAAEGTYTLETGGELEVRAAGDGLEVAATGADAVAALSPPTDPDEVTEHEAAVLALLAGETEAGREELEILEDDLGPIDDVELAGTITEGGELRSYVTLTTPDGTTLVWYALDEAGGIAAVEITDAPPTFSLVASGEGGYRLDDPAGRGPDVTVTFDDGVATITGSDATTVARRSGG